MEINLDENKRRENIAIKVISIMLPHRATEVGGWLVIIKKSFIAS